LNGPGENDDLSARQDLAIAALLAHPTIPAAAESIGVSESTLRRWLRDAEFKAAYRAARRQVVEQSIAALQAATTEAVATLRRNLQAKSPHAQIRAAMGILDHAVRAVDLVDVMERLEKLEAVQRPDRQTRIAQYEAMYRAEDERQAGLQQTLESYPGEGSRPDA
jgi:hypothetical protein